MSEKENWSAQLQHSLCVKVACSETAKENPYPTFLICTVVGPEEQCARRKMNPDIFFSCTIKKHFRMQNLSETPPEQILEFQW